MKRKVSLVCILCLLVSGCQTAPSKEAVASAEYGPYPDNYKELIQAFVARVAIDPDPNSTKVEFELPVKGYMPESNNPFAPYPYEFGWIVNTWVNGKNRYGGYTGERPWTFLLRDGEIRLIRSVAITGYYARPTDWR